MDKCQVGSQHDWDIDLLCANLGLDASTSDRLLEKLMELNGDDFSDSEGTDEQTGKNESEEDENDVDKEDDDKKPAAQKTVAMIEEKP